MTVETEQAWAAGFFDGEGSSGCQTIHPKRGCVDGYKHMHMKVGQNERGPLDRFAAAVETGKVYGPYKGSGNSRPYYLWQSGSTDRSWLALQVLWPYLGPIKRAQAESAWKEVFS